MKKILTVLGLLTLTALSGCGMLGGTTAASTETEATGGLSSLLMPIGIMVVFFILMYFMTIRPQKKEQAEKQKLLASMMVGDTVLTTAGFYGVVIDITEDTVIVEFGNNKNCRIPMQKSSIIQLEHPEGSVPASVQLEKEEKKNDKK